ncbi:MAG: HypC/HybG/HupF family hydrogenase formation chaperone, partial [Candidatus Altiarchaeales archaeon HGW-Altiarchaeales-1]
SMVENLKIDDYVLVHAGFAIEILSAKDADETISLMLNLKE